MDAKTRLAACLLKRSLHRRQPPQDPFILASGKHSWHYLECQRTTSYAAALPLIGEVFYEELPESAVCVGGLTRGADPIADAVAFYSALEGRRPVSTFSVRKSPKDHGTGKWIEGSAEAGDQVVVVDDVVTSGGSVIKAIEQATSEGLRVVKVLVLVDREEQDGIGRIEAAALAATGVAVPVQAIYRYADLLALEGGDQYGHEPAASLDRSPTAALQGQLV